MHIPHSISQGVGRCVLSSVVTNYPRPLTHHFWTTYLNGHGLVVKVLFLFKKRLTSIFAAILSGLLFPFHIFPHQNFDVISCFPSIHLNIVDSWYLWGIWSRSSSPCYGCHRYQNLSTLRFLTVCCPTCPVYPEFPIHDWLPSVKAANMKGQMYLH